MTSPDPDDFRHPGDLGDGGATRWAALYGCANGSYRRRFTDPQSRPSNLRCDPVVEHTQRRVERLARWLDRGAGAEVRRGYDPVVEAMRHIGHLRRGDPGE